MIKIAEGILNPITKLPFIEEIKEERLSFEGDDSVVLGEIKNNSNVNKGYGQRITQKRNYSEIKNEHKSNLIARESLRTIPIIKKSLKSMSNSLNLITNGKIPNYSLNYKSKLESKKENLSGNQTSILNFCIPKDIKKL
jgi:hypothetical protein